jgi:hypothetical protein
MTMVLRVVNWDKHFENNRTRELVQMRWVPFQNSFDGDGFIQLLEDHTDGLAHFGCWVLIVEVASKCSPRGTLITSLGKPHTPDTMSRKTRSPSDVFSVAVQRLLSIGWLEEIDIEEIPQETATFSQDADYGREGREGRNGSEEKVVKSKFVPPTLQEVAQYCKERKNNVDPDRFWHHYDTNGWVQGKNKPIKKWQSAVVTWEKNRFEQPIKSYNVTSVRPPLKDLS